jgi:hypothetical protein
MTESNDMILKAARREEVVAAYSNAVAKNKRCFLEGDDMATSEYIYPNQIFDANNIVDKFYKNKNRVISVQKKTKVGADGLMIEIAKLMTTYIDDDFVVNPTNVRIITGMSNVSWEKEMIDKAPDCFKKNIFHHGKLKSSDLTKISNGLIIIDEIDTGDKERQVLHRTLKEAGILDVKHMEEHNNYFLFISATMIKELYDLYRWGELHEVYKMTIPKSYIGHKDFLEKGIIKEFYPLNTKDNAEKWIKEDIIDNYGNDYRIHIVRINQKNSELVHDVCIRNGVLFINHTSTDRIEHNELVKIFKEQLKSHIVIAVKGFFRRANLIPNKWKLRIGATHEIWTKKIDNNVQIQGLPGRMSGYWREDIENGHKTGPHRTSIKAIEEYDNIYEDPFGVNSYDCAGFKKNKGKVTANPTMLNVRNINNLDPIDLQIVSEEEKPLIKIFDKFTDMKQWFDEYDETKPWFDENRNKTKDGPQKDKKDKDSRGFYKSITKTDKKLKVRDTKDFEKNKEQNNWAFNKGDNKNLFIWYPGYRDINDIETLEYWLVYYKK